MMAKSDADLATVKHRYRLSDGSIAPSVTAICDGFVDDGKSRAFAGAAARLTREGKVWHEEWKASGDRGTRVHDHLHAFTTGKSVDAQDDELAYLEAAKIAWRTLKIGRDGRSEFVVISDAFRYGGRGDYMGPVTWPDGERCHSLLDWKTGDPWPLAHAMQVNAYANGDGFAEYDDDGKLLSLTPFDKPERVGCVYLSPDGYRLIEYPLDNEVFGLFTQLASAKSAHAALKKRFRKAGYEV